MATKSLLSWAISKLQAVYAIDTPDTATPANNAGKIPMYDAAGYFDGPTPPAGDNSTRSATTAYADRIAGAVRCPPQGGNLM